MFERVTNLSGIYPPLFSRYTAQDSGVAAFFDGNFWEKDSYCRRAFFLRNRSLLEETGELLVELNRNLPLEPLPGWEDKLRDRRTLFVITGQQPGLFAGPLLVLYKSLAAVKLARHLEVRLQVPVQPLFWVASDDHNVDPLLQSFIPLRGGGVTRLRLPPAPDGLPAGMPALDNGAVTVLLEQLSALDGNGGHKEEIIGWLQSAAQRGGNNLSGWFLQIISRLFRGTGLIYFDPRKAAARGLYLPLLLQTLELFPCLHERITGAEEKLRAAGFPLQVKRRGAESLIMITWEKKRYPLLRDGQHYYTPGGELSISRGELLTLIVKQPSLFSPGVLLRPLFQEILFPTLAYVAGPAELAYFAQIKGLYSLFGLEMPILYPRPGVTLMAPPHQYMAADLNFALTMFPEGLRDQHPCRPGCDKSRTRRILRDNLWPRSRPQERVFSIVPYLFDYGFAFWQNFCRDFPYDPGHYIYSWKEGV